MLDNLSVVKIAGAMARHAAAQHQTATRNIANVDTPGYRALEVAPFDADAALKGPVSFEARRGGVRDAAPNGNTVSLSAEMLSASQAQMQHQTALGIYRKTLDILRLGLGRRG